MKEYLKSNEWQQVEKWINEEISKNADIENINLATIKNKGISLEQEVLVRKLCTKRLKAFMRKVERAKNELKPAEAPEYE